MIHVLASISVVPGKRDELLAEFQQIVPLVRAEVGCIEYGPAVDAQTEMEIESRNVDRVVVVEKWASLQALQDHLVAAHMVEYRGRVKGLVQGMDLKILQPAEPESAGS